LSFGPPKLDNYEKQPAILLSGNLNFRQLVSKELLKVTTVCTDTPFQSFSILIYHNAALAFIPCLNKDVMRLAQMLGTLCCFIALSHVPDHSMNSQESHSKNFSLARKINPVSGYENLSSCG